MSRINQPDTLLSELREIQRRLRLLEGSPAAFATPFAAAPARAVPGFAPARQEDWPGTTSTDWTPLVRSITSPGRFEVIVETVADEGTSGEVRLNVDGTVPTGVFIVTDALNRYRISANAESDPAEVVVEARRTDGAGVVRAVAFALS